MKRKLIIIFIIIGLSFVLYLIFKNIILSLSVVLLFLILEYLKTNNLKKQEKKLKQEKEYEFANLLSYLLVFLENDFNVYQSLQLAMGYCKDCLVSDVEKLINEIDIDKSIIPYQNFANQFESNVIYQIIMMIYQLDINGYDAKYLRNFPGLIDNLRQARIENILNTRKANMSFMTVVPIASLLLVVFGLVFFILMELGGTMI